MAKAKPDTRVHMRAKTWVGAVCRTRRKNPIYAPEPTDPDAVDCDACRSNAAWSRLKLAKNHKEREAAKGVGYV